jgi:hypothetical protein
MDFLAEFYARLVIVLRQYAPALCRLPVKPANSGKAVLMRLARYCSAAFNSTFSPWEIEVPGAT